MDAADLHEWVSVDVDGSTYVFDVTFLASDWTCIFGDGCLGVHAEPRPELVHGCCSHGAHFTGKADRRRVEGFAERLTDNQWQFRRKAAKLGGPIYRNEAGDVVTRTYEGACIFANRVDFPGGPGCALHAAALAAGERPIDWKPEVCWQLPLRLDHHLDDNGHITYTLREWKRRDWGEGGDEFAWWCTESGEAFRGRRPVFEELADEIVELVGEAPYAALCAYLAARGSEVLLPHPAVRRRTAAEA